MFAFLKRNKDFFSPDETRLIVDAIKKAELLTSGEVRVFVESRCRFVDAMDRAREIFDNLKMGQTKERNGVLIYVAIQDHQLAVLGDEGIHQKVGNEYWNVEVGKMITLFTRNNYAEAIVMCIEDIGEALHSYFPYDNKIDKNELPDDIVFGR
ncbi:MAG: TPM domain-containing protein [Chitinophagaceae bacterium]